MVPDNEQRYASTATVAQALGVSVTTVKRWVDDGILPAHKTVGGHRKLLMADVLRLVREGRLPKADMSVLVPKIPSTDLSNARSVLDQLTPALLKADTELIRALIHGAYLQGIGVDILADKVISPGMASVGHAWEDGRLTVMQEHRATQAVIAALYELRGMLRAQAGENRPIAVGGAPEHDSYILPTLLAKLVLLECGWDAINLGPHTPGSALRTAIHELKPQLIWLSISHVDNEEVFLRDFIHTYHAANNAGIAIAVGGIGLQKSLRERMPYTFFGDGFTHLASFAKNLHRLPTIRKRGRPKSEDNEDDDADEGTELTSPS